MDLSGKVCIITGASSGIGKSLSIKFASRGASVALAARRNSKLASITDEINQTGGVFNASPVRPVFNRFNTEFLDGLDWNFSGGVIRFSGDRQDVVNEEWFNAQAEIAVSYDITNDVTTIAAIDGLPCDATGDDGCDTDDLQIVLDNFLRTDPRPTRLEGNFNFDPTVDHKDFLVWRDIFLANGGSLAEISAFFDGNPVPEPSTLWLISMSGVALVARSRHR